MDELVRAIRENPKDDAARIVYGDWLLQRGDPRGELIAAQHAGLPCDALIAKHDWLGPIDPDDVTWRLGFLESAHIYVREAAALAALPVAAVLHTLELWFEPTTTIEQFTAALELPFPHVTTLRLGGLAVDRALADELATQLVISDLFDELSDMAFVDFSDPSYAAFDNLLLKRHVNYVRE